MATKDIVIGNEYRLNDHRVDYPVVKVESRDETGLWWVSEAARGRRYPTTSKYLKPLKA